MSFTPFRTLSYAALLGLSGCVSTPIAVTAQGAACSTLIPPTWAEGVAAAPLPDGSTVGDWIAFGDAQTARLEQANGRTRDVIGIVTRCEERDREAVTRATRRRFLGMF